MSKQLTKITFQIPIPAKSWFRHSILSLAALTAAVALVSAAFTWNRPVGYIDLLDGKPYSTTKLHELELAFGASRLNSYHVVNNRVHVPYDEQFEYREVLNKLLPSCEE